MTASGRRAGSPSGQRIVVTGGAGFLGSHLCRALLARGDEVVAIDNLITGSMRNIEDLVGRQGFTFQHHDVSNYVHVSGDIDAVMHLASPASPADFERIPIQILKVGSRGTQHALGLAKDKNARFFLASTSEVYGDPLVHPQPETYWGNVNPIGPRGVYDEAKRFAEAMTFAYHRYHQVDVRVVRIFNSILSDEQILFDDGTQLRRETAGALAERLEGRVDLEGYTVPGFDAKGSIEARRASAFVGHPTSARCYEVRTRYGRSVRVTGDHSIFVEGPGGTPVAKPVTELAVGDRVAIVGRINVPERDRRWVRMEDVIDDAGIDPWNVIVRAPGLGQLAWRRRVELFDAIREQGRSTAVKWRNAIWSEISGHRDRDQLPLGALRALHVSVPFDALFRVRSAGHAAELPAIVHLSDELLWFFGLMVAEGCRHERAKNAFLTISCESDVLDRAAKVVERELNLHIVRSSKSDARGAAIFIHSKLLLRLLDHLGFTEGDKRIPGWALGLPLSRLKWLLEGYREGDGVHSGRKFEEQVRHEFSTTSTALKDDLVVAFGRFGLVPSVGRYHSRVGREGTTLFPFWRLTLARVDPWSPLDWDRGVEQTLQARRSGDIVWAPIRDIVEVPTTELVYDFCVPGFENFVAGSGVLCHNTFGPSMRPDDGRAVSNFLVQALHGKPITVFGDGTQTRSFTYVDDEIRGFLALLDSDETGPINIGNDNEFTILELAQLAIDVTGSTSEIVFEPLPVDDPTQRRPDLTLARTRLGWEPTIQLREGLERTAAYFKTVL